jgi:molybdate transport system substrate-binding protein
MIKQFQSKIAPRLRRFVCLAVVCGGVTALTSLASAQEVSAKLSNAQPGDVRLFVSGAMRAPVTAIQDQLERVTGRRIVIQSTESRLLQVEIEAGQPFEVAFLTKSVINELIAKGKIVAGSEMSIAASRVGVSVRGDAPKLEIATPEGLKSAILGSRSIRRSFGVAASTPTVDNLFAKLGVKEATDGKIVHIGGGGSPPPEDPLSPGQYELIINQNSAIMSLKGWRYLGPIPEQFQIPVHHSAGLGASGDLAMGRKVMDVLRGAEFEAALKANGITGK